MSISASASYSFRSACAALLVLGLAACGGGGGGGTESASSSPTQAQTTQAAAPAAVTPAAAPAPASVAAVEPSLSQVKTDGESSEALQGDGFAVSALSATAATSATVSSLVPLAPITQYVVSTVELVGTGNFSSQFWSFADSLTTAVPSELRTGGMALRVNSWAGQKFHPAALQAGKSYVLTATARKTADTGTASMSVVFRDKSTVSYRNFRRVFSSRWNTTYTLHFTAPAYTEKAEVSFSVSGVQAIVDSVSLKMEEPIAQTEPVTSLVGSYVPAGYALAFNDEFNGSSLNRNKWFTRYLYDGGTRDRLNDEKQRYRDNDNHQVANGVLSLVARKVTSNDPQGIDYESGMIRSDWTTRYGYIEARVKMPGAVGVWPAFWLNSDVSEAGTLVWPPEIDVFEMVNNGVEDKVNMLHTGVITVPGVPSAFLYTDADFNTQWTYWTAPFNFNEGWHTIATEWTPTTVTTYVDGKKIVTRAYEWKDSTGALGGPAHILLNLAVGGQWAGRHGIDTASFPQTMQITWVRAYKKIN